jgi:hypothetical protein
LTYVLRELVAAVALVRHEELDLALHVFARLVPRMEESPAYLAAHFVADPLEPVFTGPVMRNRGLFI